MQLEPLLTIEQVAQILSVNHARAAELVRRGILPSVRLGRQLRVDPQHLRQFIDSGGKTLPGGWRREARTR